MRPTRVAFFLAAITFAVGCSKSKPPIEEGEVEVPTPAPPPANISGLMKKLRSPTSSIQMEAIDGLSKAAPNDPSIVPALIEALGEKGNRGLGTLKPSEPASTREAAVMALMRCGPAGETALVEKGLPILIAGLTDPTPAIREHSAGSIARMGEKGRPAADKLWVLAADPDGFVRGAAYDALKEIRPESSRPYAALLAHKDARVRDHASEHASDFPKLPPEAAPDLAKVLKDANPQVRAAAASALVLLGKAAKPALDNLLKAIPLADLNDDGFLRNNAYPILRALAVISEPAVEPLTAMLEDMNSTVRWQAAHTLGLIGQPANEALPKLEKHFNDENGQVVAECVWAYARVGGDVAKATPLIDAALKTGETTTKVAVLQLVARLGSNGQKFTAQIVPLLSDEDDDIRQAVVEFIGSIPAEDAKTAVPLLGKMLTDRKEGVGMRRRIAEVLAELGPAAVEASDSLGKAVGSDPDPTVKLASVEALRAIGPAGKAGLAGLIRAAGDTQAGLNVRVEAILALPVLAPGERAASEAVLKASQDAKTPEVRTAAASALAHFKPQNPASVTRLGELAGTDKHFGVRLAAFRSLAELGPSASSTRAVIEPLAAGSYPDIVLWAKVTLARMDVKDADAGTTIRAGLESKSPAERLAAVTAFPLLSPMEPADIQKLATLLRDPAARIRKAAVEILGECGPNAKSTAPAVVKLVRDSDPEIALAAVVALGKLGEPDNGVVPALRQTLQKNPAMAKAALTSLRKLGVPDDGPRDPDQMKKRRGMN